MEFTSKVLFEEDLTYYNVRKVDEITFVARLLDYPDFHATSSPREIVLKKSGERWIGNADEVTLHYLNYDINKRMELAAQF